MGESLATPPSARARTTRSALSLYPPCAQMKVIALLFTILAVATGFATPPSDDPPVPWRTTYSGSLVGHSGCMIPSAANYDATADVSDQSSCVFCQGVYDAGSGACRGCCHGGALQPADCYDCPAGQFCDRYSARNRYSHLVDPNTGFPVFPPVCEDR